RELYLEFCREVLERYEVDGIVIDWMRHLPYFNASEAEAKHVLLTDMHRKIRKFANEAASRYDHPVKVWARIPATLESSKINGFDPVTWANEKLVDRLILAPRYMTDTAIDAAAWKKLLQDTSFPVTACVENRFMAYPGAPEAQRRQTIAEQRGACWALLHNGSDGIYYFNHMAARNDIENNRERFSECGSIETLVGKNRDFRVTYNDSAQNIFDYTNGWRDNYFNPGSTREFARSRQKAMENGSYPFILPLPLQAGKIVGAAFAPGPIPETNAECILKLAGADKDASVIVNGHACPEDGGIWHVKREWVSEGKINLEIKSTKTGGEISDIIFSVKTQGDL
ncbi:MAG: hypothetical protein PHV59_10335, partial [Victivallales bacterium]|nr:hypothetical protein [Victivallales bacterium]